MWKERFQTNLKKLRKNIFRNKKVYKAVSLTPKGKVTTYKQISKVTGVSPRLVGRILHLNKNPNKVPCHRVVNIQGKLAENYAFGGVLKQKEKLKKEGVTFLKNGNVNLAEHLVGKHAT